MKGHGEKLSRKQELGIAALLTEPTIGLAARKIGVGEVTLWRWLQNGGFKHAYLCARRSILEAALGQLQQTASDAVQTLARNLSCGSPGVEVHAAKVMLDQAVKGLELLDLADRVSRLEQQVVGEVFNRVEGQG